MGAVFLGKSHRDASVMTGREVGENLVKKRMPAMRDDVYERPLTRTVSDYCSFHIHDELRGAALRTLFVNRPVIAFSLLNVALPW